MKTFGTITLLNKKINPCDVAIFRCLLGLVDYVISIPYIKKNVNKKNTGQQVNIPILFFNYYCCSTFGVDFLVSVLDFVDFAVDFDAVFVTFLQLSFLLFELFQFVLLYVQFVLPRSFLLFFLSFLLEKFLFWFVFVFAFLLFFVWR